jgi:import inner membrane translocase subunit TIM50
MKGAAKDKDKSDPETPHFEAESQSAGGSGGRGEGDLPKSAYESSIDKRRNRMAQIFYMSVVLFGTAGAVWAGRDWESEEEAKRFPEAPSGWGMQQFYNRIRARIKDQLGYYTEPTFPKLLPSPSQEQPAPPYTLVISLENMLVHSEWTREHGWRTAKRPGVDFFLLYLSQYYELCLFTSQPMGIADPVVRKLDPYHLMQWQLFREATRYDQGEYVKVRRGERERTLFHPCAPT